MRDCQSTRCQGTRSTSFGATSIQDLIRLLPTFVTLSGLTKVVGKSNGWACRGMEQGVGLVQQRDRGLTQTLPIGPKAMAGELLLEEVPDALEQIEVRGIGRQPEREAASVLLGPPGAHRLGAMVTDIVQHQHQILLR